MKYNQDKDLLLLEKKASDLLLFIKKITKIKNPDIKIKNLNTLFTKISLSNDIEEMKTICNDLQNTIYKVSSQGFSKSAYRLYGEEMRFYARNLLSNICLLNINILLSDRDILNKIESSIQDCLMLQHYFYFCLIDDGQIISKKNVNIGTEQIKEILDILINKQKCYSSRCDLGRSPNSDNSNNVYNVNSNGDWNNNNASNSNGVLGFDKNRDE